MAMQNIDLFDEYVAGALCTEKAEEEAGRLAEAGGYAGGAVMTWIGAYDNWPKARPGYHLSTYGANRLDPAKRGDAIAIYKISEAGALEPSLHVFLKTEVAQTQPGHQPMTQAERDAQAKEESVQVLAGRMAVPKFAGTALEGRSFWPRDAWHTVREVSMPDLGEGYMVSVELFVTREEHGAQVEAAGIRYDEEKAEAERVRAEKAAAQEAEAAAKAAGWETLRAALTSSQPCVVTIDRQAFFRWTEGDYADVIEGDGGAPDQGFESIDQLLDHAKAIDADVEGFDSVAAYENSLERPNEAGTGETSPAETPELDDVEVAA